MKYVHHSLRDLHEEYFVHIAAHRDHGERENLCIEIRTCAQAIYKIGQL